MGANCQKVCLSLRILLVVTRAQVLGANPILTRGSFRRWGQAALPSSVLHHVLIVLKVLEVEFLLVLEGEADFPLVLEAEFLLVLLVAAKQVAHLGECHQ